MFEGSGEGQAEWWKGRCRYGVEKDGDGQAEEERGEKEGKACRYLERERAV